MPSTKDRQTGQAAKEPSHWPPYDGYVEAMQGWHASPKSKDWLLKPATGVYFHMPSQTLWRKSRYEKSGFARVDMGGLQAVTLAAFGESKAGLRLLLKAAFFAWQRQKGKFEEMDRDITERPCEEATMTGHLPRSSAPGTAACSGGVGPLFAGLAASFGLGSQASGNPLATGLTHLFPPTALRSDRRSPSEPSSPVDGGLGFGKDSSSSPSKSRGGDSPPPKSPVWAEGASKAIPSDPRPRSALAAGSRSQGPGARASMVARGGPGARAFGGVPDAARRSRSVTFDSGSAEVI
eukprot:gnl/TRDRNA2_/TRDRNA2_127794_c0_seq1.p1 gnl/TRDRNA2_/TRDRNA2_127794_c0~~gnl/TRDRNA2_/TRDRNA2_127794_c0_seq1.p1  ORF type:complete len:293 (-),score=36.78 gnl/TRDRNA2_/TRDRNA2_127794_c0_seq1:10-888(-)